MKKPMPFKFLLDELPAGTFRFGEHKFYQQSRRGCQ